MSAQQAWQRLVRPTFGERPGLAVLPFANLSPDPENAYFADGLHEEILATLARAGGLRVISRTSVQAYRDTDRNLREIATTGYFNVPRGFDLLMPCLFPLQLAV